MSNWLCTRCGVDVEGMTRREFIDSGRLCQDCLQDDTENLDFVEYLTSHRDELLTRIQEGE